MQGVGFRPFVYLLASQLKLTGYVVNDGNGVTIEICGGARSIDCFRRRLLSETPPLAVIDHVECREKALTNTSGFTISASKNSPIKLGVTPDVTLCPDCLAELFTPENRRYRHPFINCTHCGPRYSVVNRLPYDRSNTSMSAFELCGECLEEYQNPLDRRFHAQPVCCLQCGPKLRWVNSQTLEDNLSSPIEETVRCIQAGGIVAIKGIGGFHLLCDARNRQAVEKLRYKKQRKTKPLAVMACNTASLDEICFCSDRGAELLSSQSAPIVLLPKISGADSQVAGIAPGLNCIGAMLPYTPIHYLLFHAAAGYPSVNTWLQQSQDLLLVVTSANARGEPLLTDNDETITSMSEVVDGYLLHDRDILQRCDDSVIQNTGAHPVTVRRGRGLAPQAVRLRDSTASILAVGGLLKNTVCLSRDSHAFLSPYIGDLHNVSSRRCFEQTIEKMQRLFQITPTLIVRDSHPDFYSSQFAQSMAVQSGCEIIEVQHHHAHVGAVAAEHQLAGPIIGLALDGLGLGSNGELWGGELLKLVGADFERLGHITPLPLPGGDKATQEPWRIAAGILHKLHRGDEIEYRFSQFGAAAAVVQMMDRKLNVPETSSAGRLFDAAAALLGVKLVVDYEAQAAMMLEALAGSVKELECVTQWDITSCYKLEPNGELNFYPLLSILADESDAVFGAQLFHKVVVAALEEWVMLAVKHSGITQIVLTGGCFMNTNLRDNLQRCLGQQGVDVYQAEKVPCNDSGLSLGQVWVAQQLLKSRGGR